MNCPVCNTDHSQCTSCGEDFACNLHTFVILKEPQTLEEQLEAIITMAETLNAAKHGIQPPMPDRFLLVGDYLCENCVDTLILNNPHRS